VGVKGANELFTSDRFRADIYSMRAPLQAAGVDSVPSFLLPGTGGTPFTKIHAETIVNGIELTSADLVDSSLTVKQWKELLTNISKCKM